MQSRTIAGALVFILFAQCLFAQEAAAERSAAVEGAQANGGFVEWASKQGRTITAKYICCARFEVIPGAVYENFPEHMQKMERWRPHTGVIVLEKTDGKQISVRMNQLNQESEAQARRELLRCQADFGHWRLADGTVFLGTYAGTEPKTHKIKITSAGGETREVRISDLSVDSLGAFEKLEKERQKQAVLEAQRTLDKDEGGMEFVFPDGNVTLKECLTAGPWGLTLFDNTSTRIVRSDFLRVDWHRRGVKSMDEATIWEFDPQGNVRVAYGRSEVRENKFGRDEETTTGFEWTGRFRLEFRRLTQPEKDFTLSSDAPKIFKNHNGRVPVLIVDFEEDGRPAGMLKCGIPGLPSKKELSFWFLEAPTGRAAEHWSAKTGRQYIDMIPK